MIESPNFGFLDPNLAAYAVRAERYVFDDANTSLVKLRQFAELLARHAAAYHGIETTDNDFRHTIRILKERRLIPREIREHLDLLRLRGNEAAHEGKEHRQEALEALIAAHRIAIWFHRTFTDDSYQPNPFRPPPNPAKAELALKEELESLRDAAARYQQQLDSSQGGIKELERVKRELESEAEQYHLRLRTIESQQKEERQEYERQLRTLREKAKAKTPEELHSFVERSRTAASAIGFRGEAAQHIPLAQIRVVSPRKSSCHKTTKLLAQSSAGGFVLAYCTKCGRSDTVKDWEFQELDLWVSCPNGHGRMKATTVRYNYGFRCETCGWKCYLASLLPKESELGIVKE